MSKYLWYSEKQRQLYDQSRKGHLYYKIDETDEIVECTLITDESEHGSRWDDMVFFGKGVWHHGRL